MSPTSTTPPPPTCSPPIDWPRARRSPAGRMTINRSPIQILRTPLMKRLVAATLLAACVSAPSFFAADDKDAGGRPITVELKTFTFEPSNSELLGHQDEQGRLFFYINGAAE